MNCTRRTDQLTVTRGELRELHELHMLSPLELW